MTFVVIETPDGTTYEQAYDGSFEGLLQLKDFLGDAYWIVDIIDTQLAYE